MLRKLHPKCEYQGWLSLLKLAKVYIISSLLYSVKAAGHLNEIQSHHRFFVQMWSWKF